MQPVTRLRATALTFALIAAGLPPAARLVIGPRGATVHVRWDASVDPAARRQLEARFRLADGRHEAGDTWRYDLIDPSLGSIRALVLDPAVADTHHIARSTYSLAPSAVRTARRQRVAAGDLVVRAADRSALTLAVLALLMFLGQQPAARAAQRRLSGTLRQLREGAAAARAAVTGSVARWIPALDARALGAFRVVLGCGFLWIAAAAEINAVPLALQNHFARPDWPLVHQLAASPQACDAVGVAMLFAALVFTVGLWARWAYAAFVAAFFLYTLMTLESSGAHDLGLPLVTFLGWLTVPWAEADILGTSQASRRHTASAAMPSRIYGFAVWWPGLTLGIALLAAAYAKLTQSGLAWITGGAVKYHFVEDAANAAVDWGLWAASHQWAAVLLSLAAVLVEAMFILNVFTRGAATRLAAGAAGAGLFLGLYLFQGIYWRAWMVLLLAFLPWMWLNRVSRDAVRAPSPAAPPAVRMSQIVAVALFLSAQVYASAGRIEAEPLLSNFPMYSSTYASPEDFEQATRWRLTRFVEARADGQDVTEIFGHLRDNDRRLLMELAEQATYEDRLAQDGRRASLCERYSRLRGAFPAEMTLTLERRRFDWRAGRFLDYTPVSTSPVRLARVCHDGVAARITP